MAVVRQTALWKWL